jgi:hypothetical protein
MKPAHRGAAIAGLLLSAAAFGQALPGAAVWRDREQWVARAERVAEAELKTQYLRCARESSRRLLGFDEAAVCTIVGDALKARSFGGDFNALLAWWRLHRDDPLDEANDGGAAPGEASARRRQ